ncbi:MAG TPA: metallophosphoesterase family protein [Noviherbaspirillum sp.]
MEPLRIGLISDTHGLLRPEARVALRGCAHILHAGDICDPSVLDKLAEIAPVTAVRGNNDRGAWAEALPVQTVVSFGGVRVCMVHDAADFSPEGEVDVVVTGHSHKPAIRMDGKLLHVNPGSAGPRRFTLPISVGFLEIADGRARARLQTLEVD